MRACHLPLILHEGTVGHLTLQVPWQRLDSEPIVLRLRHVRLRIGWSDDPKLHAQIVKRKAHAVKLQLLAEQEPLAFNTSGQPEGKNPLPDSVAYIINHLKLEVHDLRVEIAFAGSAPHATVPLLLHVDELSVASAEWEGPRQRLGTAPDDPRQQTVRKLVCFAGLSVQTGDRHLPIVEKAAGQARVELEWDSDGNPQISLELEVLPDLELSICRERIAQLARHARELSRRIKHSDPSRPSSDAIFDPRGWFQYFARTVLSGVRERRAATRWENMLSHWSNRKAYIQQYKWLLHRSARFEKAGFSHLEEVLPLSLLVQYRRIGRQEFEAESIVLQAMDARKRFDKSQSWSGWLGLLVHLKAGDTKLTDSEVILRALSKKEMQRLYASIDYGDQQGPVESDEAAPISDGGAAQSATTLTFTANGLLNHCVLKVHRHSHRAQAWWHGGTFAGCIGVRRPSIADARTDDQRQLYCAAYVCSRPPCCSVNRIIRGALPL